MAAEKIIKDVYYVGAKDNDRKIFDSLIPLPDGTSYNSYLVIGKKKTAIIDSVDPSKTKVLLDNLDSIKIKKIDYIISNHSEQDHSGSMPRLLEKYPDAKVVASILGKNLLKDLLLIEDEKFIVVKDNETIDLGEKTIKFISAPWVHWPETMISYLVEDKILFSCDLFGSHIASNGLYPDDTKKSYTSAKRYYSEIMMPFRKNIQNHLQKIKGLDIKMIAPSHGFVHNNPKIILDAYHDWVSDDVKKEVVIIYVSMHGSTEEMVRILKERLDKKIVVKTFNLDNADLGEIAMSLVDASTVVLASPAFLLGSHPKLAYAAMIANSLKPKTRFISFIGSFGWSGGAKEQVTGLLSNFNAELIEPIVVKGFPKKEDVLKIEELADEIIRKNDSL